MKLKTYLLFSIMVLSGLLAACDDDKYVEPLLAPTVQMEYMPTAQYNEIKINLQPSKSVTKFNYALGHDEDMEAFLAGNLTDIRTGDGSETVVFTGLNKSEVYTIFAIGFTADGKPGPLAMMKVKTRGELSEIAVTEQFVSERSAAFNINGSINYFKYVFALGRTGDKDAFEKGLLDGIREKEETANYTATFFDLDMDADYVFFLTGYDRLSNQPTETIEIPIRTAAKGTVPAVDIKLDHIDIYSGDYRIIPNDLCPKFGIAATIGGLFDEVIENENSKGSALDMMWLWERGRTGDVTLAYQQFPYQFVTPALMLGNDEAFNHPIELYILIYGEIDGDPISVQRFTFETPSYDDNQGEAQVSVQVTDIHDNGAMYEFIMGENCMGLVYETVDEEWYEDLLKSGSYYEGYMEDLIYMEGYWNYVHEVKRTSFPEATAQPGRRYRVFYMGMNYNGPFGGLSNMRSFSYTTTGVRRD